MKLQVFGGGKATRLAPQLLNQDQGVVYTNIDNATGVLSPVKDSTDSGITTDKYFKYYSAGEEFLSSPAPTDYLEFQRVMYLTDRGSRPQKYSDGQYNNLGITRPTNKPNVGTLSSAIPFEDITAKNDIATGDLPLSDLNYLLFNVKDDVYSSPIEITVSESATDVTRGFISLATKVAIQASRDPSLTTVDTTINRSVNFSGLQGKFGDLAKLYRRYNGEWRLVGTFGSLSATLSDNVNDISGNELLDATKVTSFNGTYQYLYTYYNANDGTESAPSLLSNELELTSGKIQVSNLLNSSDPQVTNKRLYRVGGNVTTFTLVAQLGATTTSYVDELEDSELEGSLLESENYYEAPNGLKFLSESYAMLFGAVGPNLRFTPIGKPNAWPPEFQIEFDADITGIGPVANGILVMTEDRAFVVTGTGPLSLVQQPLRGDQGCIAFESIQQVVEGTLIWASKDGLCTSSGNNVRNLTKNALGEITLTPNSSTVLDEQYYCHNEDGTTFVWDYRFNQIPKDLELNIETIGKGRGNLYGYREGKLFELFSSTVDLPLTYKSPRFVEGSYVLEKTYKKFYIRHEGDIILKILIDDEIVATKNLAGMKTSEVQIPQVDQRGFSFQFEISGTGTVQEFEYQVGKTRSG